MKAIVKVVLGRTTARNTIYACRQQLFATERRRISPARAKKSPPARAIGWVEVLDKESGQKYWWNQSTDETTELGAPKPTSTSMANQPPGPSNVAVPEPAQSGGMMSGLGRVVAEGMAFGVGSSLARAAVGSMFGGGGDDSGAGSDDGGGDTFDI